MDTKACTKCRLERNITEFPPKRNTVSSWCRPCCRSYAKERRKDPAYRAKRNRAAAISSLKTKYDLTPEEYQEMSERQGFVCAICGEVSPGRNLAVDHDHVTGKVRGLLCIKCNRSLGGFKDDPVRLRRAADYLEGKL